MSTVTKPIVLDETVQALNHLIAHQNAAIDVLAADKRADLVTNVAGIAELAKNGELLEVMDYGDEIHPEWVEGTTHYNPAMNLCHESDELLEDGESIHGCFFEWDKTIPFGVPFDEPEAIYSFDGTEGAGTFNISIGTAYGTGWLTSKVIQFTLDSAPDENDQLVIDCGANNANDPTNSRNWYVYAKGSTTAKQSGTTSNGASGTNLGTIGNVNAHTPNGKLNAISRVVYGYNRWSQSGLRQWLNSAAAAGSWWTPQNAWDRPPAVAATKAGFLAGYNEDVRRYFKPIKVVTVACDADGNAEDVTYDKVFLSSLEQMYCVPQFSGKEGSYWEYYKRLLGRTSPAPTSATYARLIKYGLGTTSAQYCFRRSAYRSNAGNVWYVSTSGRVGTANANTAYRCAPSVFISD